MLWLVYRSVPFASNHSREQRVYLLGCPKKLSNTWLVNGYTLLINGVCLLYPIIKDPLVNHPKFNPKQSMYGIFTYMKTIKKIKHSCREMKGNIPVPWMVWEWKWMECHQGWNLAERSRLGTSPHASISSGAIAAILLADQSLDEPKKSEESVGTIEGLMEICWGKPPKFMNNKDAERWVFDVDVGTLIVFRNSLWNGLRLVLSDVVLDFGILVWWYFEVLRFCH